MSEYQQMREEDYNTSMSSHMQEREESGGLREGFHLSNRGEVHDIPDEPDGVWISWPTLAAYVGPGFLVCIAYLDPGNLEADLQTGAYTGYQLLWVLLIAHILGLLLQSLAARLGVVTGLHLAVLCRENYPRGTYLALWAMTELAVIGSDIQEVLGSAIGFNILLGVPLWLGCLLTVLDTFTFLFVHIFGVRKLEMLFVVLVSIMTVAFFTDFSVSPPSMSDISGGFSFTMKPYAMVTALGLIGAVIMPHNIYLHSALVLSRDVDRSSPKRIWQANKYYTMDSAIALAVAFMINLAVLGTFAKQFYSEECARASTASACLLGEAIDPSQPVFGVCGDGGLGRCQEIGLSSAGNSLRATLGGATKYVWAVGLLATWPSLMTLSLTVTLILTLHNTYQAAGQSSTMTGTYAGQFVMEGFLQLKVARWQRVLLTRIIALGPALVVTIALRDNFTATDRMSAWLNVLQSLQLPFAIIPLLSLCNSESIMGEFRIGRAMSIVVWVVSLGVIGVNVFIVGGFVLEGSTQTSVWVYFAVALCMIAYIGFISHLLWEDMLHLWAWMRTCLISGGPGEGGGARSRMMAGSRKVGLRKHQEGGLSEEDPMVTAHMREGGGASSDWQEEVDELEEESDERPGQGEVEGDGHSFPLGAYTQRPEKKSEVRN